MLREIEGIAAEPATRRRWFHDDYFDLFVWQTDDGAITLFQLCYGIEAEERALVWHREAGLFHDGADPGISLITQVVERFETAGKSLPRNVRNTVGKRIREHVAGKLPAATRRSQFRRENWQKAPGPQ